MNKKTLPKVYAIDTNIILQDINNIDKLSDNKENIIAIAETVLIELESKKKLFNELGYAARRFSRIMNTLKTTGKEKDPNGCNILIKENDLYKFFIITKDKYKCVEDNCDSTELNDKKIIEAVKCLHKKAQERAEYQVKFLSLDNFCRTFAELEEIETETLFEDKDEVPEFNFLKTFSIEQNSSSSKQQFEEIRYKKIVDIDPGYNYENFAYEFIASDGNKKYATISNGLILLIDEDDFDKMKVKPVNIKQKLFVAAILSDYYELLVIDAKAGSGKTLMAIASAMALIDEKPDNYNSIVYIRNSIESIDKGADIGYLSGNDEKFRIYNHPLYDSISFIAKQTIKKDKSNFEHIEEVQGQLITKYNIQTMWVGEMRGRTLSNCIIILDEMQNTSNNTTQMLISRLDDSCKAIVIGSNRQIDNMYLNKYNNGLTKLMKLATEKNEYLRMFSIILDKAVRGKFAEFSESSFENKEL